MITLRLDPKLEQRINKTAKNLGLTKSELISKSIHEYLGKLKTPSAGCIPILSQVKQPAENLPYWSSAAGIA